MSLCVTTPNAGARLCFVPAYEKLDLIATSSGEASVAPVDPEQADIEIVGAMSLALSFVRRRFTSMRRAALDFDGVTIVPEGSKRRTAPYRKLVKSMRAAGLAFDGDTLRAHPELVTGWRAEARGRPAPDGARIAVAIHLYYVELWDELEILLGRWNVAFRLFLTLTQANAELERRVRTAFPDCEIHVVANSGRDVRPFLILLEAGAFENFDLVCKVHGKRSLRAGYAPLQGELVRRASYLDLIGSAAQVQRIVAMFQTDRTLGLVGPERFRATSRHRKASEVMGASRARIETLALRMGGPVRDEDYDVFHGTMFWAKPQALAPIARLSLARDGFEPEAGLSDGALEHALEGLFNHSARLAGFAVAGVAF